MKNFKTKNNAMRVFNNEIWTLGADGYEPYTTLEENPTINKIYPLQDKGVSIKFTSINGTYARATIEHLK